MKILIALITILLTLISLCKSQSGTMIDVRDGKEYKTIKIGEQLWMAENLDHKVELIANASPISYEYAYYFADTIIHPEKYGFLYNWIAAKAACPAKWHLPDESEFDILIKHVTSSRKKAYEELLKQGDSGFNALPESWMYDTPTHYAEILRFLDFKKTIAFWTAQEGKRKFNKPSRYSTRAGFAQLRKKIVFSSRVITDGYSVRCIKD